MQEYIFIGLGLAGILLILFLLVKFSNKFRSKAYKLFLFAEHNVIKGRKMEYVVNEIYENYLPLPLKIFPEEFYQNILQKLFDEIKDLLEDGKFNK